MEDNLINQKNDAYSSLDITFQGRIYNAYREGEKESANNAFLLRQALDLMEEGRDCEAKIMVKIVEENLEETTLTDKAHEALALFENMKNHNIKLKKGE